ncbi:MAG TPA: DHA2 family efflux MFS transporter permease subunit [Bryobacteraceae bacterium]|jgi:DHA2 family multidrug resistance protein|nr:DHA2 family efflux MFS transporter permease subunit [Bryobacteraceae bacterium]
MASSASAQPQVNPWIVAVAVMFGTFMEVLDTTVVNVSLPHIAGNLSASVDEASWALTSYLVANAIVLPITGWLANYFGRKRILMTAVTGFTIASVLCGLAPSLPVLIFFRVIQGATGGALQPLSQAVMLEAFPPQDRGKAMAFWGLGIVVAPMLGPVLGGWLTDTYSWRWVFYINLPVGAASIIMTRLFIFDPPYIRRTSSSVDYWGIGYLALGIGALQVVLDKGQEDDWFGSHAIVALTIAAAVGIVLFIMRELMAATPVVHLSVFRDRTYSAGVFLMTVLGFVLYGSLLLVPIFLQTLLGYPALEAGIAMAPRGLGSFLMMPLVGAIMGRFDPRKVLAVGLVGGAWSLYALSELNLNAGYWDIFWPQFIQGAALALLFVPLTTATMNAIPKQAMGNATSMFNLMRNVGGSMGIAAGTTYLARREQIHLAFLGAHVYAGNPNTQAMITGVQARMMAHGADMVTAKHQAYEAVWGMVQQQSAMQSFVDTFRGLGVVFLLVLPFLLFMKRPAHRGGPGAGMH